MIDLYTAATGNGRRPALMLEECGLPYTVHKIDLAKGEQRQPSFLALNPVGSIPVIVDRESPGGQTLVLAQSAAILLYLAEKTGRFLPKESGRRALVYQWLMHIMADQQSTSATLFQVASLPDKPTSAITYFENRLSDYFRLVDRQLAGAEYLAGELSIADFALYPLIDRRREIVEKAGDLAHLRRWMAALAARPAIARAMQVPG